MLKTHLGERFGRPVGASGLPYDGRPMSQAQQPVMRHVIAALVTNEPGVLAGVAGMFAARGFNIDSLVVGRTENAELSRMTIVVNGDNLVLEQVRKQLKKLVPVVRVADYKLVQIVERDLMLVQVATASCQGDHETAARRSQIIELANLFRARVVDVSHDRLMIELSGTEAKLEAFIDMIEPYGIVELARTGVIAMPRGHESVSGGHGQAGRSGDPDGSPIAPVDPKDLPPG